MSNATAWAMIVGFISSLFIIPIIQQPGWSAMRRSVVTFAYCILAGLGTIFFAGDFNLRDSATTILTVFVLAIGTYKGLAQYLPSTQAIEHATSPSSQGKHTP